MSLRCLGNWKGHDGQNYLALWDPALEKEDKPRYRCAVSAAKMSRLVMQFEKNICVFFEKKHVFFA